MLMWQIVPPDMPDDEPVTIGFRLYRGGWGPVVGLLCLLGGVPVGVLGAVALVVAGVIAGPDATFRLVLGAGTLLGAGWLYLLVARRGRYETLRVIFDGDRQRVGYAVEPDGLPRWVAIDDVIGFRLVAGEGAEDHCALVLDTASEGPVTLVMARRECDGYGGLPGLVARLNAHLGALGAASPADLPSPPAPPIVPHLKVAPSSPATRRRLPDLTNSDDHQSG